jgi:hypothetical protein
VYSVIISPSGTVYASGVFTASGTTSCASIAQLMGSTWVPLGSGLNTNARKMSINSKGDLIVVGGFSTAGGVAVKGIALWNGSSWVPLDIEVSIGYASPVGFAIKFSQTNDIYFGGTGFGGSLSTNQSQMAGITLINNVGSTEVSPFVYIQGTGRLIWLENQTSKKRIFFDLTILAGEEVFIDFGKGTIESTVRGSLFFSMLPGSDFNAFTLMPGENKIACLITKDVGASVKMGYQPVHWSMDRSS